MEPSGRNQWQPVADAPAAKPQAQAKSVAVGCEPLPLNLDGKEGVNPGLERCSAGSNWAANASNGSAQPCESLRKSSERPHEQSDPVPFVVQLAIHDLACHAGGRGFESRRSRSRNPSSNGFLCPAVSWLAWQHLEQFWYPTGDDDLKDAEAVWLRGLGLL
jgi:hypothetical protein